MARQIPSITLQHGHDEHRVPAVHALTKCSLFRNKPSLVASPYQIRSSVGATSVQQFITALEGDAVSITMENVSDLSLLCEEFGFDDFGAKLCEFRTPPLSHANDRAGRLRISALEEWAKQRDRDIAALTSRFRDLRESVLGRIVRLEENYARVTSELGAFRSHSDASESAVRAELSLLSSWTGSADSVILCDGRVRQADLRFVSDFPEVFRELRCRGLRLLWRGSRDGFGSAEFHGRCDGHANTLTVILDTDGNVFGGFTPVEWESRVWNGEKGERNNRWKGDDSLKSFIFTLKNPHNVPARKFGLKPETRNRAIKCTSEMGPHFCDFGISNHSNENRRSNTSRYIDSFGFTYNIDTEIDGRILFTGASQFQVNEIEVFELTP
jgi:hypothetical protein